MDALDRAVELLEVPRCLTAVDELEKAVWLLGYAHQVDAVSAEVPENAIGCGCSVDECGCEQSHSQLPTVSVRENPVVGGIMKVIVHELNPIIDEMRMASPSLAAALTEAYRDVAIADCDRVVHANELARRRALPTLRRRPEGD